MKSPFVSRAEHERALRESDVEWAKLYDARQRKCLEDVQSAQALTTQAIDLLKAGDARYDGLLEKYHALKLAGHALPEPEKVIPAPWTPPPQVMAAIRLISPTEDAAYRANITLCYQNREECEKDPGAFATRIKRGRLSNDEQPARAD